MFFLIICVLTNPGIIPQIVKYYETDSDLFVIPSQKYLDDDEDSKYLFRYKNMLLHTKYCS